MPSEDTDLNVGRQSFGFHESGGVVLHLPVSRVARNGGIKRRPPLTGTLLLAMFVLGAGASAGLTWLTTPVLRSGAAKPVAVINPRPARFVASSPSRVQLGPDAELRNRAADPALTMGAGLERWWMDVQESVKPAE